MHGPMPGSGRGSSRRMGMGSFGDKARFRKKVIQS